MMRRRLTTLALPFALSALVLSACGDDGDDTAASAAPSGGSGDCPTDIGVGVLPLADYAAVYWAEQKGFFNKEGLTAKLEPLQGGPIGVQKVIAGELEFSFSNPISTSVAAAAGAPIATVALTSSLGNGTLGVFVKPDSSIQGLQDLNGKSLAVNTLNNIGDTSINNLIKTEGLNVKPAYVEVPFPEVIPGLKSGSIDAGYLPEPFLSAAKNAGLRQIADVTSGANENFPAATFVTSKQYAQKCPKNVSAFQRALNGASADIKGSEQEFREFLPTISQTPAEVAKIINLPVFETELKTEQIQSAADVLIELGKLPEGYKVDDQVIESE